MDTRSGGEARARKPQHKSCQVSATEPESERGKLTAHGKEEVTAEPRLDAGMNKQA